MTGTCNADPEAPLRPLPSPLLFLAISLPGFSAHVPACVQGVFVPELLDYGLLHEGTIAFIVLSAGGEDFSSASHVTQEDRSQARAALQARHQQPPAVATVQLNLLSCIMFKAHNTPRRAASRLFTCRQSPQTASLALPLARQHACLVCA